MKVNEAAEVTPEEQMIIDEVKALIVRGKTNVNITFRKSTRRDNVKKREK